MADSKEVNPLGDAFNKAVEHVSKQAGWLPLFACITIAVTRFDVRLPSQVHIGSTSYRLLNIRDEWTIPLVTLALFLLGDVLDKAVFKKRVSDGKTAYRWPEPLFCERRRRAKNALKLGDGSYSAALGIVSETTSWPVRVVCSNELAKFLRSLVLPAFAVASYLLYRAGAYVPLAAAIVSFVLAIVFVWLKETSPRGGKFTVLILAWAAFVIAVAVLLFQRAGWPLWCLLTVAASLCGSMWLKHWHICLVYEAAKKAEDDYGGAKYCVSPLTTIDGPGMRLVFWDGKLVGSATAPEVSAAPAEKSGG